MNQIWETTLKRAITIEGVGLHTGAQVSVIIEPAPPRTGIVFTLETEKLPLHQLLIESTELCVGVSTGKSTIKTVEHLLSAIFGCGLVNAYIRVLGPEIPILDGSTAPFVEAFEKVGFDRQALKRQLAVVVKPVMIRQGDRWVGLWPKKAADPETLRMEIEIEFEHAAIGRQSLELNLCPNLYKKVLARARTFGFLKDVETMRRKGLIRGASLENAIVWDDDKGVLNPEGLRYPNECVRHKALDAVGDLALLGYPIIGRYRAFKPGHTLNAMLIKRLRCHSDSWELYEGLPLSEPSMGLCAVATS